MKKYLLGQLGESETQALEGLYFADPRLLRAVEEIENELIRDFHVGRLSTAERTSFEERYLSVPELRNKVEAQSVSPDAPKALLWRLVPIAAAVCICLAGLAVWRNSSGSTLVRLTPGVAQSSSTPAIWKRADSHRGIVLEYPATSGPRALVRVTLPDAEGRPELLWESGVLTPQPNGEHCDYVVRLDSRRLRIGDHLLQLVEPGSADVLETYVLRVVGER